MVGTGASNLVSVGVLSQPDSEGTFLLLVFYFKKHSPSEANCGIYDQNLIVIVWSFEEWGPEVESVAPENMIQV